MDKTIVYAIIFFITVMVSSWAEAAFKRAVPPKERPQLDFFYKRREPAQDSQKPKIKKYRDRPFEEQMQAHEDGVPSMTLYDQQKIFGDVECKQIEGDEQGELCEFEVKYPNGVVQMVGQLRNGSLDGTYREYYEIGQLMREINRQDGRRNGRYVYYYPNGNLRTFKSYLQGIQQGPFEGYYIDGTNKLEAGFQDGRLVGEAKAYDEFGNLRRWDHYVDGQLTGLTQIIDQDGRLLSEISFVNGVRDGVSKQYGDHGQLIREQVYQLGNLVEEREYP